MRTRHIRLSQGDNYSLRRPSNVVITGGGKLYCNNTTLQNVDLYCEAVQLTNCTLDRVRIRGAASIYLHRCKGELTVEHSAPYGFEVSKSALSGHWDYLHLGSFTLRESDLGETVMCRVSGTGYIEDCVLPPSPASLGLWLRHKANSYGLRKISAYAELVQFHACWVKEALRLAGELDVLEWAAAVMLQADFIPEDDRSVIRSTVDSATFSIG